MTTKEMQVKITALEIIKMLRDYQISVGNSVAGEMARDMTLDALKEVTQEIREKYGV